MENRTIGLLSLGVFMAMGLFFASPAHAYWNGTHEYLTSESVDLFNKTAGDNAIANDLRQYLYDGVKAEDADPRYVNHFYDPVNDTGLEGPISGESSKKWANDQAAQRDVKYALQPKTGLSASAYKKISKFYPTSDFTWNAALRYWINGDKEMAMETLGHVLHLIEDLGVPEHTRNESHMNGSKYEIYANKYSLENPDKNFAFRLGDKKPIELGSLDAYFDSLARYSNKYFYSPGSIGISGGYDFPEPDYKTAELKNDKKYYVKNTDDEGRQYYLAAYSSLDNIMTPYDWDVTVTQVPITESYWNLLSVRTVRTGAGVIDLFFRDVERAKADPSFLQGEKHAAQPSFFGQIWGGVKGIATATGSFFGNLFNSIGSGLSSVTHFVGGLFVNDNGLTDVGSVDLTSSADTGNGNEGASAVKIVASKKNDALAKKNDEIAALKLQLAGLRKDAQAQDKAVLQLEKAKAIVPEVAGEKVVDTVDVAADKQTKQNAAATPMCAYGSVNGVGQRSIVINEVAWMGGVRSASDEWIELKNVSGGDIDVSGWQLVNKGGGVKVHLSGLRHPVIKSGQFILLERTDNNSAVGATADLIYSGALANSNEGLRLFDGACAVVDEIPAAAKWSAGNNDTKQTMERDASGYGWHTSSSAGGTPKKENSVGMSYSGGGGTTMVSSSNNANQSGVGGDPITLQTYPKLLITEVQLASASSTHDEFVKLYNPNDVAIDLTGWYVQKKTKNAADYSTFAKTDLFTGRQIASHGYFVIAHPSSSAACDIASDYGISDDNTLALKDPNGDIVDKVGWGAASDCEGSCAADPVDGQQIKRTYIQGAFADTDDNAQDFELSTLKAPVVSADNATTTEVASSSSTSTVYWDGGAQSGMVYELFTDRWVGQRVHFSTGVDVGEFAFGYYNDHGPGSVDVALFDTDGARRWEDSIAVPMISYGGYVTKELPQPLHLAAGDYFLGSKLVAGNIGIRKGYGANICGVALYGDGILPDCIEGNDVSMQIGKWMAPAASSTSATSTPLTPGTDSGAATTTIATTTPRFYPVVINEIMYDLPDADDGREWIELYNTGTSSVDVADWRLYENGTNHLLDIRQGTSTLPIGGYAVIANDSTRFLQDNPGFLGALFDSAFSLSNDGETIILKNGDLAIDTVAYASSTGANGDGKSLQKFIDGWRAASSTPGMENILPVVVSVAVSTSTATTTDIATATSTATTTEPTVPALVGQLVHEVRSNPSVATYYVQAIQKGSINGIKNIHLYVEGNQPGVWNVGICRIPERNPTKCLQNMVSLASAQQSVMVPDVKTELKFDLSAPITLDPTLDYALYVRPSTGSTSVLYGDPNDSYTGGYLAGFSGIEMFNPGIRNMYFGIN